MRRTQVACVICLTWCLQVFCYTGDKAHEEMRQACFDYLRLGGMYSSGPISLLSGMNPRPSILVMHFFMVAIFGVGRCASVSAPRRVWSQPQSVHI